MTSTPTTPGTPRRRDTVLGWARRREVAFLVAGGANTVFGFVAFAVLFRLFGTTVHYLGALVLAYAAGILMGFYLQRRFVFRVDGRWWPDLVRYTTVQLGGFALNAALLSLLVEVVELPVIPAQVLALVAVAVSTYVAHSLFSFRRTL